MSLSWLVAMLLGATLYCDTLKSYLDACFDAMSGFATIACLVRPIIFIYPQSLAASDYVYLRPRYCVITAFLCGSPAFKMYVGEREMKGFCLM